MRLFILAALLFASAPAIAADPIHVVFGSSVATRDGTPITDWVISYSLYSDIGPDRIVTHDKSISVNSLKLDGVKYDPENATSLEGPHNEVLQWCSLHWPVSIEVEKDGTANLIPLKGEAARKVYKMAGNEDWKSPWEGTKWRHCGLKAMRELNREFDKKNPPKQPDYLGGPTNQPQRLPADVEDAIRNRPTLKSPHGRLVIPMNGRRRIID